MDIHEYQAKSILAQYNVPVPKGILALSPQDAEIAAQKLHAELGTNTYVVKSQIHAGGRGKAGGVKLAKTIQEVNDLAKEMLGKVLVTHQTGPEGREVRKVYIEEAAQIDKELYLGVIIDRETSNITFMGSSEGGVEIEEVAARHPEKIIKVTIDTSMGYQSFHGTLMAKGLGLHSNSDVAKKFYKFMKGIYDTFVGTDASQIEINPLMMTKDGNFVALDAKINFDDNALFRHSDLVTMRDLHEEEPLETRATKAGLNYVKMNGNIGCMVNGAGLAMATMDIIKLEGGNPANFLDVGGGATREAVTEAFRIILSDPNVKGILINIFGGIMRCDIIAEGVISAARDVNLKVPLVVRLAGTNVDLGKKILAESSLPIISADDLGEAAKKIVQAVKESK